MPSPTGPVLLPQQIRTTGIAINADTNEVTIFPDPKSAEISLQRAKLGRPNSNLQLRRCEVEMRILDL